MSEHHWTLNCRIIIQFRWHHKRILHCLLIATTSSEDVAKWWILHCLASIVWKPNSSHDGLFDASLTETTGDLYATIDETVDIGVVLLKCPCVFVIAARRFQNPRQTRLSLHLQQTWSQKWATGEDQTGRRFYERVRLGGVRVRYLQLANYHSRSFLHVSMFVLISSVLSSGAAASRSTALTPPPPPPPPPPPHTHTPILLYWSLAHLLSGVCSRITAHSLSH